MKQVVDAIHHFFIPRHSNNFKAKLLHHDALTGYLIFALVLTISISVVQRDTGSILGYATDISPTKLFELTNGERENEHLSTLTYKLRGKKLLICLKITTGHIMDQMEKLLGSLCLKQDTSMNMQERIWQRTFYLVMA